MKKVLVAVLALALALTGCSASEPVETEAATVPTVSAKAKPQETVQQEGEEPAVQETESPEVEEVPAEQQQPETVRTETPTQPQQPAENPAVSTPNRTENPQPTQPKPTTDGSDGWYLCWKLDESVIRFDRKEITIPLKGVGRVAYSYTGNKKVKWRYSDGLLVDKNGNITAVKAGTHTVSINDNVYAAVLTVIVQEPSETAKGNIYFEKSAITIQEGDSMLVSLKGDISGGYVTYTSSNPNVVTMSGEFLLAVWEGTAVITASHGGRTATMTVTVTRHPDTIYLDMSPLSLTLKVGDIFNGMEWDYNGKGKLRWSSSDSSVARVDAYGNIEGVSEGTCTIWLADEMRAEGCKVTVVPNPDVPYATAIKTGNFSQPLYDGVVKYVGEKMTFDAWVVPEKAKPAISVSSSNRDVVGYWTEWASEAEDSNRIHLIFSAPGTAKITLRSVDGKVTKTFQITVEEAP